MIKQVVEVNQGVGIPVNSKMGLFLMNRLKWVAIIIVLILPLSVFGQAKVGTTGLQFLKVGVGARAVGMASFTAVADDATALYYNPGGLTQLMTPEATFSYINYPAGLNFIHFGGVYPVAGSAGAFGIQVTSMYSDEMIETTPERPYGTGRTFTASDLAAGVSYGQRLTQNFSVGVTFKYLNEQLADKSASGWGADVGTFYSTGWKRINIGMVIHNFGPDMDFENSPFPLPISFRFGASIVAIQSSASNPYKLTIAGEFVHPNDNLEVYIVGAEFQVSNMLCFRAGKRMNGFKRSTWEEYQDDPENDPYLEYPVIDEDGNVSFDGASVGFGLKIPEFGLNIDYAFAGMGALGAVHRFTLGYKLAGLFPVR